MKIGADIAAMMIILNKSWIKHNINDNTLLEFVILRCLMEI